MINASQRFGLTERQSQIAALIGRGEARKSIALTLNISVRTVDDHLAKLRQKMGADSNHRLAFILFPLVSRKAFPLPRKSNA